MSEPDLDRFLAATQTPGLIGLAVGICEGIIMQRYGSWRIWCVGLISSALVAILLGLWLKDSGVSIYMQWGMIGLSAYMASDILAAVGTIGSMVKADPFGLIARIREAIKGGPSGK